MVFEFTQISATQPEKPYSFAVKVEGESFTGEIHQQQQRPQMQATSTRGGLVFDVIQAAACMQYRAMSGISHW
jgi:hypothetical protein